ncbi:hypothetical protein CK203_016653 [Vitis vinifera]|uniref:DUF7804 domain-containing protein n=1 Tax=Vitis vinifera TaxID=29760 RepID=A0A438J230_VITVI|nr:hypothetical protein CK203_016653 [Vitis vinifera]
MRRKGQWSNTVARECHGGEKCILHTRSTFHNGVATWGLVLTRFSCFAISLPSCLPRGFTNSIYLTTWHNFRGGCSEIGILIEIQGIHLRYRIITGVDTAPLPKQYLIGRSRCSQNDWRVAKFSGWPTPSMAALGVRFGGNNALRSGDDLSQNHRRLPLPRNARPMTISSHVDSGAVKISSNLAKSKSKSRLCLEEFGGGKIESLTREKMDEWIRESVSEIVKNLREAPLLVEVYSDRNGGGTKLKTEKAVAEDWPHIESNWKIGEAQSPEGIMLVEELNNEADDDDNENDDDEENTKLWGW